MNLGDDATALPLKARMHGRADYLLYVDQRGVRVIGAEREGTPLSDVEWQSAMYAEGLPADVRDPLHQRF